MIAAVRGILEGKTIDSALVTVGGVTLRVLAPLTTLSKLNVGEEVHLHTLLHVREDAITLFGFATVDDRETFEQLREAVLNEDVVRLTMAPGVGKKLAARLVLELRPRFEKLGLTGVTVGATVGANTGNMRAQVVDALTGLGYTPAQATAAVRNLPTDSGDNLEDLIMRALRLMATE